MFRSKRPSSVLALLALLVLAVVGNRLVHSAQGAAALVKTAPAHILVSATGRTLYIFAKDQHGVSACTGQCAKFWPPLLVPAGSKVPTTMPGVPGKFGESMLKGGTAQLTYYGSPLYMFANDKKPGDMNGQGVIGSWWAVVVPAMY